MAAPATTDEFLRLLTESGLLDPETLTELCQQWRGEPAPSLRIPDLAENLRDRGLLTAFQAAQLLKGHARGFTIGKYRILDQLGSGSGGTVYLCEQPGMSRLVAIKVLPFIADANTSTMERFRREARALASLAHPNIVHVHDFDQDVGRLYLVMEYVEGASLRERVRSAGRLDPATAANVICQAARGLNAIHDAGLVHRDIKPANIFAAVRGGLFDVAKLLDFGLAKPLSNFDGDQITQEGTITGSPLFMSPEQAIGDREPDARSDVYAMGSVLYFLLTGKPPFENDKPMRVLIAHAHDAPVPPSHHNPDVPDDLELIVMRCLQKNPDDRYQRAAELMLALDDCDDAGRWTRDQARDWWQRNERGAMQSEAELVAG